MKHKFVEQKYFKHKYWYSYLYHALDMIEGHPIGLSQRAPEGPPKERPKETSKGIPNAPEGHPKKYTYLN